LIMSRKETFFHPTAQINSKAIIGDGTKIWQYCTIMDDVEIGQDCNIGQNVFVESGCRIGNNVKIKNNIALYTGVTLEDNTFIGPNVVFTNVINPRSFIERKSEFRNTLVKKGASLGANVTVVCGNIIGEYALIGAGSVVTKDIPAYALAVGNPAKVIGHVCYCGEKIAFEEADFGNAKTACCSVCGRKYQNENGHVTPVY